MFDFVFGWLFKLFASDSYHKETPELTFEEAIKKTKRDIYLVIKKSLVVVSDDWFCGYDWAFNLKMGLLITAQSIYSYEDTTYCYWAFILNEEGIKSLKERPEFGGVNRYYEFGQKYGVKIDIKGSKIAQLIGMARKIYKQRDNQISAAKQKKKQLKEMADLGVLLNRMKIHYADDGAIDYDAYVKKELKKSVTKGTPIDLHYNNSTASTDKIFLNYNSFI